MPIFLAFPRSEYRVEFLSWVEPRSSNLSKTGINGRKFDLSLQIPSSSVGFASGHTRRGSLEQQGSLKSSPTSRGLLWALSFKKNCVSPDAEKSALLNMKSPESSDFIDTVPALARKRCTSLPVSPASDLLPSIPGTSTSRTCFGQQAPEKGPVKAAVSRSLSVPEKRVVVVLRTAFAVRRQHEESNHGPGQQNNDEEIAEDAAICRICLEACDEGSTLKMECSCKGALSFVHEECAVKWFTTKGTKSCDVCGQDVRNLPVTLLRLPGTSEQGQRRESSRRTLSAWQDFVVLVLVSTICYFFFLEQLLIHDMKKQAVVLAAPFSLTLAVLASAFAIIIAIREYIWTYAALEFVLVAVIIHLLYTLLEVKAVYAILLSSVLGFGIAICFHAFYVHVFTWRVQVRPQHSSPSFPV